jgi:hypothetical protein
MVDQVNATQGTQETQPADPAGFKNSSTEFKNAAISGTTTFHSWGHFKSVAPEVAKAIEESIGMTMCRQWAKAEERRKEMSKKYS